MKKNKVKYLIIGAGITGLSFARKAKEDYLILEKEKNIGGYCRTIKKDGFIWDYAGHFYHFDMYRVENEFEAENIGLSEIIDDKNSIKFIEWAENVPRYLPPHYKKITIAKLGKKSRNIILEEI